MDIRLLDGEVQGVSLGVETLISIASRQRRREYYYRSLLRCALLTLLFLAFGCFFAIYAAEKGYTGAFFDLASPPFDFRGMLKELFLLSSVPSVCFASCCLFGGRLYRLCDTVFPAVYGIAAGMFYYTSFTSLFTSFSVSRTVTLAPYLAQTLCVIAVYTLFCPVCACYGRCRCRQNAESGDLNNCFTYFLVSLTVISLSLILRDTASFFLKMFG